MGRGTKGLKQVNSKARTTDLIFDVGMHVGRDSEFYLKKGYRVVAVEANPDLCSLAEDRLREHVISRRLIIINEAIANYDGNITLHLNEQESEWSTIDQVWAERNVRLGTRSHGLIVKATRFSHILEAHGIPYYLKIDIEGADLLCLEDLASFDTRPKFISIESQMRSFDEFFHQFAMLWTLGYRRYKIVPQHKIMKQKCPLPAKEGKYVDHRFVLGSSGLFGRELPGEWLDIEGALNANRRILRIYRLLGYESFLRKPIQRLPRGRGIADLLTGWYDIHAMYSKGET